MNGKGDTYRPVNKKKFDENYDRIFYCSCKVPALAGILKYL